jgi:hypothetical protein
MANARAGGFSRNLRSRLETFGNRASPLEAMAYNAETAFAQPPHVLVSLGLDNDLPLEPTNLACQRLDVVHVEVCRYLEFTKDFPFVGIREDEISSPTGRCPSVGRMTLFLVFR